MNQKNKPLFIVYTIVTGIFIFPILGIIAPVFILSSIVIPVLGLIKMIVNFFGHDIPFIVFQIGSYEPNSILGFLLSIIVSVGLYFIGKGAWRLLIKYMHSISKNINKT